MVRQWLNYSKNRIRISAWNERRSDGLSQMGKSLNIWKIGGNTIIFFVVLLRKGRLVEEGGWVFQCFMTAITGMTHPTHPCSSVNVKTPNNLSLWHRRWRVMSQLTESWFPKKRGRRLKASVFEPTQHYQATQRLNLSSLRSLRAVVVLRCSFHFSPAPPTGSNLEHCPYFN